MILKNRLFDREPPSREAKSIYIFCEGVKREFQYFKYFRNMDSRINIEIYDLDPHDNNSPKGLLNIAETAIIKSKTNPSPKYSFQQNDEVWIVFDRDIDKLDSRLNQIKSIRNVSSSRPAWNIAESNPCFEVWLFYHLNNQYLPFKNDEKCRNWKRILAKKIPGGFDSRKHPILIQTAISNAKNNFKRNRQNELLVGATEVLFLSESLYKVLKPKIELAIKKLSN